MTTIFAVTASIATLWLVVVTTIIYPLMKRNRVEIERNVKVDIGIADLSRSTKRLLATSLSHERRLQGLEYDRERFHGASSLMQRQRDHDEVLDADNAEDPAS